MAENTNTERDYPELPQGWPARFRCDSCDGNGEVGDPISMGYFQPPERERCPDCDGKGWCSEEDAFSAEHMRAYVDADRNARASLSLPAAGQEPVATSASGGDWENPTTVRQRLGDAVQLLCAGKRPDDSMLDSWLKETSEELQSFCASHGPAWCQGIALIDAAMLMVDQPTEITTITHPDRDHEHRAAPQPAAPVAGQEPVAPPMDGEIALIEKALERAGISSLLNHGAASCVFTEGCCGVSQDQILAYTREIALHCAVALGAAPQPAVAAGWPLIARALDEWHEDDGPVMWWAWNGSASGWAGEPAWCGTPLSSDWPGYHTHWTPHPTLPPAPSTEGA